MDEDVGRGLNEAEVRGRGEEKGREWKWRDTKRGGKRKGDMGS